MGWFLRILVLVKQRESDGHVKEKKVRNIDDDTPLMYLFV